MEMRTLGNTGLRVSRIGLGLAALGRPGYINLGHAADLHGEIDVVSIRSQAHAVLDAAWDAGVRYFDAARSYGLAEVFLADWLTTRRIEPGTVTVGSKWGYTYTAAWQTTAVKHEIKDHSLATLLRQMAESREMLGKYLSLYQIHSATLESGVLEDRAVLDELAMLSGTGVKIGLTVTGPRQAETLRKALDVKAAGQRLFDCVQATWNLLEPSAGPVLAEAHAGGLSVIIKEALANGRLTERNDDPAFAEQRRLLQGIAGNTGTTLDALALAAVLSQPWVDVALSGAATAAQLHSNLAALSVRSEDSTLLASALVETPEAYWNTRARLAWN